MASNAEEDASNGPPNKHEAPSVEPVKCGSAVHAGVDGSAVEAPPALAAYVVALKLPGDDEKHAGPSPTTPITLEMTGGNASLTKMAALADYVAQISTPLVRLCLSRNPIGPDGAQILGNALVTNKTLQFLELDGCELVGSAYRPQHEGVLALSRGVQSVRSTLRYVNIAHKDLQPEGCRILLGAMAFHPTLTAIDISDNMLGLFNDKQGYLALSYLLQYSRRLCWLCVTDNPLTPRSAPVLQASLAANRSLTSLFATRCGLSRQQWLGTRSIAGPAELSLSLASSERKRKLVQRDEVGCLLHTLEC